MLNVFNRSQTLEKPKGAQSRAEDSVSLSAARRPSSAAFNGKAEAKWESIPVGLFNAVGQSVEPGPSPGSSCLPEPAAGHRHRAVSCE